MSRQENDEPQLGALMLGGTQPLLEPVGEGELMSGLPFSGEIGMRLHGAGGSVAILSVPYDERLIGDPQTGVMHGGVVTALLDTACGAAVMAVPEKLESTATLDLRIDYMRPASVGQTVFARAECYRITRSVAFARAVAFHEGSDDLVASAAAAFVIERSPKRTKAGG
ncbi:MAG: PaaI family thioesterase [Pseudomonadota bacterium]